MKTIVLVDTDANEIDIIYKYDDSALNMALSCGYIIWKKENYKILYSVYDMDNKIAIITVEQI